MRFKLLLLENKQSFEELENAYIKSSNHYHTHGTFDHTLKSKTEELTKEITHKYENIPDHNIENAMSELSSIHDHYKEKYHEETDKYRKNIYARMLPHISNLTYKLSLRKESQNKPQIQDTYHGNHSAPEKEGNAPLHDLTHNGVYPSDVYSNMHQYRSGDSSDFESMSVIGYARNRPNRMVKIYRAVPDNLTAKDRAKKIEKKMKWMMDYHKIPSDADPADSWDTHYSKLKAQHEHELNNEPKGERPIKINPGDWVSISKKYAMEHGRDNLNGNFKIISKTVPAKHLHTDGNSFAEWGYNPSDN